LFVPAGTVRWWQAWVYLVAFFGPSTLITVRLMSEDRALLERRMSGGPMAERRPAQRIIMGFASLAFIGLLVVPGFDHRFGWSHVPLAAAIMGDALVIIGFAAIARVYRENSYTSATIDVMAGQTVISTGPYAIVRHPMYASASLYVLGTPLALGSWWGLVPVAVMVPFLIWRLLDEERLLVRDLRGYADYRRRVRFRLVPHVW
ncbi:MAG TPA: isoprenylcysteine carboxylmethyltransferase family protein, partial [Dongiaceae bacterium]|nr:isoprenylcysteine carboxylmethyltransferase family protein [Dongiaceae bacterium]